MEEKSIREIIGTPIEMYYNAGLISARAFNICKYNDIDTVGDLISSLHDESLSSLRNCGKKTIDELKKITASMNYEEAVAIVLKSDQYIVVPESIKTIIKTNFESKLPGYSEDCIARFYSIFDSPDSFYSFFCCGQEDLHYRLVAFDSLEISHYCYQLISEILSSIKKEQRSDSFAYELFVVARIVFWFSVDHISEIDSMVGLKKGLLISDFDNRAAGLSLKAKRVQQAQIPNYLAALSLIQKPESQFNDLLFTKSTKTPLSVELFRFIVGLKETLFQYESKTVEDMLKEIITEKYPYVLEEQLGFVADYYMQFGHYPMFFLIRNYLKKPENRQDMVFAMSSGIL